MHALCTLFDSNYLDKGLALYNSLSRVMKEFKLYILCMDDLCKDILDQMALENVVTISQEQFADDELKRIRTERSRAEYCWTCTASLLDYILENYDAEYCTYLDSDLYFYQSPQVLFDEMYQSNSSVQIVEHRFGKGAKAERKEKKAGKYCVQFNTFKNDKNGRQILTVWKNQCRAHCSMEAGEMGDQKYLSNWTADYDGVQELQNHGGGMAPWNIGRYRYLNDEDHKIAFRCRDTKQEYSLVFYHFHHLEYLDECTVNLNIYKGSASVDDALVAKVYHPYLKEIEAIKNRLNEQFGFRPIIRKHPGLVEVEKKSIVKRLQGKKIPEILDAVESEIIRRLGRKKDIITIGEL